MTEKDEWYYTKFHNTNTKSYIVIGETQISNLDKFIIIRIIVDTPTPYTSSIKRNKKENTICH